MTRAVGDQLVEQLQPLWRYLLVRLGTPVMLPPGRLRLATRPSWTGSAPVSKTIGMRRGRSLGCKRGRSRGRGDHGHLTMNQIGRHRRQPIIVVLGPAVFDRHVLTVTVTGFAQPCEKRGQLSRVTSGESQR